ncbi:MAG: UvrD-helicase domain-containing protein [Oscillospiraceae bacterium]|nr:UvrD-helicase domain-containing protein [Oscillospiraceae bacterium]
MESYLDKLNDKQREAVTTIDGPLLVLAGAGSGKTTVLANRIAYIMQNTYANPWNILAITFTNKAAAEMKSRIEGIVGSIAQSMWIGTFHSICARILRSCIECEGYGKDFIIYDTSDTKTLMKECMNEFGVDEKTYPVRYVLSRISDAKNNMMTPDDIAASDRHDPKIRTIAALYKSYNRKMKSNNALDFDDIIMLTVKILSENEDIAEKYQAQFQYILVDEYQDTNNSQYELVKILARGYGNICVVGDDDQSIYSFRGANVNNILGFDTDYKTAKRIDLEENYRSTSIILDAANEVIANNKKRMGKNLWTKKSDGECISSYCGYSEREEAGFVAAEIKRRYKKTGRYNDCAILYRTNMQSRALEEALMREAIPYKVLAGMRFYDRKEIKDIIAYLRLIYNPHDDLSLHRVINEPKRKIGTATIAKITAHANEEGASNFDIINNIDMYEDLKSSAVRLKGFVSLIKNLRRLASELPIDKFTDRVIKDSGYLAMLEAEDTVESRTRLENIEEFMNVVTEYANDATTSGGLDEFLENITLRSDIDDLDENADYVAMMTIHSAKGLEFPVVFITGMEERLFPSVRSGGTEEIEEERRLCYVAITRAKEKLYITRASSRFKHGFREPCNESRFLRELPAKCLRTDGGPVSKSMQRLEKVGIKTEPEIWRPEKKYAQNTDPAVDNSNFKSGDRVRHRKFGDGTVVQAQPFGKDAILLIDFDTVGTKRLMAAFAKLKKI